MSLFGGLADEARRGRLSRRGFLGACLALGIGGAAEVDEALAPRVLVAVPAAKGLDLAAFDAAFKRIYRDGFDVVWSTSPSWYDIVSKPLPSLDFRGAGTSGSVSAR